jgi:hypothetical protein
VKYDHSVRFIFCLIFTALTVTLYANPPAILTPANSGPFPAGSFPAAVAVADFNGDGGADLAIANVTSSTVTVLLANANGGYTAASGSPFATGAAPYSIAAGDFNGDGKADLAIANSTGSNVTVLLGDGSGGFTQANGSPFAAGANPRSVVAGDFNGDGTADLAIANAGSNNVTVLLGDGHGGFAAAIGSPFAVGTTPTSVAVGDFNKDGKADLAIANSGSNNITLLLGDGSGGFAAATGSPFAAGPLPMAVAVADFNGDKKPDLAVTNYGTHSVTVLLGDGSGGFTQASGSPYSVGGNPISLGVGDFNKDGKVDLAVANFSSNNITVLLGDGSGGFTQANGSPFNTGQNPMSVAVADLNRDGRADLAVANYGGTTVTVLLEASSAPMMRDFRGIHRSDVILYDPTLGQEYTALSNGDGTYQYVPNLFTAGFNTLRTGDFNSDGKADLVVYNTNTALAYIGMGNGDGTFAFQSLFWSPGYDFVEAGDLNGDGKTDFVLYNSLTGTMYTGISDGTGTFTYKYDLISKGYTFVRLADFTGDGNADLFLYNATNGIAFLGIGDGAGKFAFSPLFISPGYNLLDFGDLNGDGKADLILYNSANGNAATGISDGAGGFTFTPLIFSPGFTSVRLADYTNDGKADVTVYNKNSGIAYFGTGTGTGAFNFQSLFWSPGYDVVEQQDLEGDGKIDIVLYNSATGTSYTGISNSDGTFTYTYKLWGIGNMLAR